MRGLRTDRTASTVIRGHAFIQNLRRGHYELGVDARHEGPRQSIDQRNSACRSTLILDALARYVADTRTNRADRAQPLELLI
jgi:hypothetical protein